MPHRRAELQPLPSGRDLHREHRRRCWRRAVAGTCLAAAVGWAGSPVSPTGVIAAGRSVRGFGPPTSVSLVSAVLPGDAVQLTGGTLAVSPNAVNAGISQAFTLTFTASMRLVQGTLILQVPAGWPLPQVQTAGSDGFITCAACAPGSLITNAMTIMITGLVLSPPGAAIAGPPSSIAVTYSATVPPSATGSTFTATAQQTSRSAPLGAGSAVVTVTPVTTPVTTPATTPATTPVTTPATTPVTTPVTTPATTPVTTPVTTPATTPVSISSSSSQAGGSGSDVSIPLVLGLIAGIAAVFLAGRFLHHHPGSGPPQTVRAAPDAGPPAQLSVRTTGAEATHTVRIEPHPGAATTTIKEPRP